jgi:membrane-bound serine protease (ClpP class)
LVAVGLKIFPNTRLGKMIILQSDVSKKNGYDSSVERLEGLSGKSGVTLTDLRPAGIAMIDEKRVNVVSEGGYIENDTAVKVIKVDGNKVLVIKDT